MKKITKLRVCDWSLLVFTSIMLVSGLQLEVNPYRDQIWVCLHIIIGIFFVGFILWHLSLHHNPMQSAVRREKHHHGGKSPSLGICFLLTVLSSTIVTFHWIGTYTHSTIGGIHGKIGFLFLVAIVFHVRKNIRFYARRKSGRSI